MKRMGLLLLVLGVMVAAGAGIRLGAGEFEATAEDGRGTLAHASLPEGRKPVPAATRLADWYQVAGTPFLAGLVLLALGAMLTRAAEHRLAVAESGEAAHDFQAGLGTLVKRIDAIAAGTAGASMDETIAELERTLAEVVIPMVDAGDSLRRRFGTGGSALVLGPLAGAERLLNRAWSALADGNAAEAQKSLTAAAAEAATARQAMAVLAD